jgi:hypothetical protein
MPCGLNARRRGPIGNAKPQVDGGSVASGSESGGGFRSTRSPHPLNVVEDVMLPPCSVTRTGRKVGSSAA